MLNNKGDESSKALVSRLVGHFHNRLLAETSMAELSDTNKPEWQVKQYVAARVEAMLAEERLVITELERSQIVDMVVHETRGYGPLQPLLDDKSITEILVNGPHDIFIEREGHLFSVTSTFRDNDHVRHVIGRIVAPLGRRLDEANPLVDARLPNGYRVHAVIPPIALDGPVLTIRKFTREFTIEDLLALKALTSEMSQFLSLSVRARLNILVSGGVGSGKTTLLNVLSAFIPHNQRVITIEDAAELRLHYRHPHVVRLETRPPNVEGSGEILASTLLKNSLRMRPDRIIVGEVRDGAAMTLLQAMNTGHEGSLTTIHANDPYLAIARLRMLAAMAEMQVHELVIRDHVEAIDLVVHVSRMPDGNRRITHISDFLGFDEAGLPQLNTLFAFHGLDWFAANEQGVEKTVGYFYRTGHQTRHAERLQMALRANRSRHESKTAWEEWGAMPPTLLGVDHLSETAAAEYQSLMMEQLAAEAV